MIRSLFLLLCWLMKTVIKKQTDTHVTIGVYLDEAALADIVAATYDRLRKPLKIAGFRPGKAPNAMVERELGAAAVQAEVLEAATSHSYAHAVREHNLPVIAQPDVKLTKFVPYTELEYEAVAEVLPPVKLADYKHLKAKPEQVKAEPSEVDQVIEDLRKRAAKRIDVDRAATAGDEAVIDFDGSKNGQPVTGASSKNYPLVLGSGSFIPGFEDQLIGLKAGDDKTFTIPFPKDYGQKDLAGQKVEFAIKVHRVVGLELPEINDDFAQQVGQQPSLAALRQDIELAVQRQKQQEADQIFENSMLRELQAGSKLTVPERMSQQQVDRLRQELNNSLEQRSQTLAEYAQSQGKTEADIEADIQNEAKRRVELALILTEVAKVEQIAVSQADIDVELELLKGQYTDPDMQAELASPDTREEIYNHLMATRTIAKIKEYNEK